MTPSDTATASERAIAAPTFAEQMLAVLPDHAHIDSSPFAWSATWTTPFGTWAINRKADLLTKAVVKVVGPDVKITERPGDAQRIIGVLRALGALPTDPEAMREAASRLLTAANEAEARR